MLKNLVALSLFGGWLPVTLLNRLQVKDIRLTGRRLRICLTRIKLENIGHKATAWLRTMCEVM
jgi:hypothetical protein